VKQKIIIKEASGRTLFHSVLLLGLLNTEDGSNNIAPKCQLILNGLYGRISQKIVK
jgi:hypothetical protein